MASDALIEFIAAWEGGPKLVSSEDPLVPGVYDIGYGHVIHHSDHPMRITREQAEDMLRADVEMVEDEVRNMVTVPTLEHELEAVVSRSRTTSARTRYATRPCWSG